MEWSAKTTQTLQTINSENSREESVLQKAESGNLWTPFIHVWVSQWTYDTMSTDYCTPVTRTLIIQITAGRLNRKSKGQNIKWFQFSIKVMTNFRHLVLFQIHFQQYQQFDVHTCKTTIHSNSNQRACQICLISCFTGGFVCGHTSSICLSHTKAVSAISES